MSYIMHNYINNSNNCERIKRTQLGKKKPKNIQIFFCTTYKYVYKTAML